MLDTLSPKEELPAETYLQRTYSADVERIQNERAEMIRRVRDAAWNALVPACAVAAEIVRDKGVRYLHPTKGYKWIGKRRFRVRGVV